MKPSPSKNSGEGRVSRLRPRYTKHKEGILRSACEECRRSKKRCNGDFPCDNCVKKGFASFCPEGAIRDDEISLEKLKELHENNRQLANRTKDLEMALAKAHSLTSHEPHTLLQDDLLDLKNALLHDRGQNDRQTSNGKTAEADVAIDSLSSLSISSGGRSAFFGQTASSWFLLQSENGDYEEAEDLHTRLPPIFTPWSNHGPSSALCESASVQYIKGLLPDPSIARSIATNYFMRDAWIHSPVMECDFFNNIFRRVYDPTFISPQYSSESTNLAILCFVLAIGLLLDPDKSPLSPEAVHYYQMGCTVMSLDSPLEQRSVAAIQALLLMCHYQLLGEIEGSRWVLAGLAVRLCINIGLHRDGGKFKLDLEETKRRRFLMWQVFIHDSRSSLHHGRPASILPRHMDTEMAFGTSKNSAGDSEMSYTAWMHRFYYHCHSAVLDYVGSIRKQSYEDILDLDKIVREFYVPPSLRVPGLDKASAAAAGEGSTYQDTAQRCDVCATKSWTVFYLHRGFFAKAMEDYPDDPLASKYAPSILAVYNAACTFVGLLESFHSQYPVIVERLGFLFSHVVSCAMVLGAIACKSQVPLAPSALASFETAFRLFERVSGKPKNMKVLPILRKLKEQARSALDSGEITCISSTLSPDSDITPQWEPTSIDDPHVMPLAGIQSFPVTPEISMTDNPEVLPRESDGIPQFSDSSRDQSLWASEGIVDGWPTMLDVHYQRLDDVPPYTNPAEIVDTDSDISWQSFREQLNCG